MCPSTSVEREKATAFVQSILDALPNGLLYQTIYGWDIAECEDSKLYVVEANVAGFHQRLRPGFHFSGFFKDPSLGALFVARLLRFMEATYGINISIIPEYDSRDESGCLYWWTAKWKAMLEIVDTIDRLVEQSKPAIGERLPENAAIEPSIERDRVPWKDLLDAANDPCELNKAVFRATGGLVGQHCNASCLTLGQNIYVTLLDQLYLAAGSIKAFWPI